MKTSDLVDNLQGPILVLGASGFIGANLLRLLLKSRTDAFGTASVLPSWRLDGLPPQNLVAVDLLVDSSLDSLLESIKPRTLFNCVAYGAYSFETEVQLIYQTNFNLTSKLLTRLESANISAYIHAGSSSEYGDQAAGPDESTLPAPNSHYAVSKVSSANLIQYFGRKKGLRCANLRLYSVYGPLEDSSRLIPTLVRHGAEKKYPAFVNPSISRDFVYIDDVCEAFCKAALHLKPENYGDSFNIGTGSKLSIADVAVIAKEVFAIPTDPVFGEMQNRQWDVTEWFSNPVRAEVAIQWKAATGFRDGLARTADWYHAIGNKEQYQRSSKQFGLDTKHSVSAIVACYKDEQAIPIMYERLRDTFVKLAIEYEIIFVNDNSPDNSEEVIRSLSRRDRRIVGVSHSRNFGSQSAFRSGMEIASKNACVLLDGDLQDPPEMIEQFVELWRKGFDVIYGIRRKREATLFMQWAYKAFYRIFDFFSYVRIPHDAGDFSLIDRRVVQWILQFPERDLFLRGVRAYAGFKQTGVDYVRPERMFGVSTNNLMKNIGWAKKGILSFSNTPLNILSFSGSVMLVLSILLGAVQLVARIFFPDLAPRGATTVLLTLLFFGSINLFAIGILGEYIAKIFEEVKQRPHFIRRSIIKDGEVRSVAEVSPNLRKESRSKTGL
jgi:polyisoprenyl-phosphate glycosyltransferase